MGKANNLPRPRRVVPTGKPGSTGHPFAEWVEEMKELDDGEYIELLQTIHYTGKTRAFAEQLWRYARNNNLKFNTIRSENDRSIYVCLVRE